MTSLKVKLLLVLLTGTKKFLAYNPELHYMTLTRAALNDLLRSIFHMHTHSLKRCMKLEFFCAWMKTSLYMHGDTHSAVHITCPVVIVNYLCLAIYKFNSFPRDGQNYVW